MTGWVFPVRLFHSQLSAGLNGAHGVPGPKLRWDHPEMFCVSVRWSPASGADLDGVIDRGIFRGMGVEGGAALWHAAQASVE